MSGMSKENKIVVLLSSYNGEKYILEQLYSLENQSYQFFDLYIRDDVSTDGTLDLIRQFKSQSSLSITLLDASENVGALRSFEILLREALTCGDYKYFMFCDQDDVWLESKVYLTFHAFIELQINYFEDEPTLLYTDLQVVDDKLRILAPSFWNYFNLDPSNNSTNYLAMQCNVTGCTMIFNRPLALLALPFSDKTIMHDHWMGLVAATMGRIHYLDKATILYRQHGSNISGGAQHFGIKYIVKKALKYFSTSEFDEVLGRQIEQSRAFLNAYGTLLAEKEKATLEALVSLEDSSLPTRTKTVLKFRLYKHGFIRNIGLFMWLLKMRT
jgi:glycosyltransferase involved in cell wall biosynthesis